MNRDMIVEKHLNMVKKLAWSFARTTGQEFDDLNSEGLVAMMRAIERFDETKGCAISTIIYITVKNSLIHFCNQQKRHSVVEASDCECHHAPGYSRVEFMDSLKNLCSDAREVVDIILTAPCEILELANDAKPRMIRNRLKECLIENGYSQRQVKSLFAEIKTTISN